MGNRLAGMLLLTSVTTACVVTAPLAAHATSTHQAAATTHQAATVTYWAAVGTSATTISSTAPHLVRYKIYWGRCKDTCRIKVRITNVSRRNLYAVSLNARLKVNKRNVGSCYDHVGTIRAKRHRWAGCTVRSSTLAKMWNRWLDGEIRWDRKVNTTVHYEYYR
ncbi:hypothetical protein [Nonomuraea cavernae]|uniref:Secreted protein n=1 Tax=Nonomuraea cavernae TaxID=2045107 RepID=A0A917YTR3_9ACTN|nr:hypothetical protein [Nonomuraea cavernae]MCA2185222.1 hypothetical protein [Nonomuraea cavernae]GGO65782.1 hypothetical protein GCM10012289_18280 [Nonomuraea cavernae]